MPTVPRYTRQVEPSGLPVVQTDVGLAKIPNTAAESVGAIAKAQGVIEGNEMKLASAQAKAIQKIKDEELKRANDAFKREVELEFSNYYNITANDVEMGMRKYRGKDALAKQPEFLDNFQGLAQEQRKKAMNADQIAALEQLQLQYGSKLQSTLYNYTGVELRKFEDQQVDAFVNNQIGTAIASYQDEKEVINSLLKAQVETQNRLISNGVADKEIRDKVLLDVSSSVHKGVISRMVDDKFPDKAKEWFDKYESEMTPEDRRAAKSLIKDTTDLGKAQQIVDELIQRNASRAEADEYFRGAGFSPELRKEAESIFNQRRSNIQQGIREEQNSNYIAASNIMDKNQGRVPIEVIPRSLWNTLTEGQKQSLNRRMNAPQQSDPEALLSMYEMIRRDPMAISKMTRSDFESKFWTRLNNADRAKAANLWTKRESFDEIQTSSFMTVSQRIEDALKRSGFINQNKAPSKFTTRERELFSQVRDLAEERVNDLEISKGKGGNKGKATTEEIKRVVDSIVSEKSTVGGWKVFGETYFGKKVPTAIAPRVSDKRVPYGDIPPDKMAVIERRIKSEGKQLSIKQIEDVYFHTLNGDDSAIEQIFRSARKRR